MRGFSLIETMIAMAVLAVSLLGLAQLFGVALYQNSFARYNTMAITVGQGKLEQLKGLYNADLETGNSSSDLSNGTHGPESVILQAASSSNQGDWEFLVSWTVTSPSSAEKTVTVTVAPRYQNPLQTKTLSITSHFSP